ncbi:hypothetical protein FHX64_001312 [Microbacter margulisiae]|uniref:Uncharacterized protein n=1 Tax=Microbacter margulisiae TaxID=1350067 RepID=A0A7W5DRD8_9PORP|nr:hypothetical protein [Microbacter margulisiae]
MTTNVLSKIIYCCQIRQEQLKATIKKKSQSYYGYHNSIYPGNTSKILQNNVLYTLYHFL